MSTVMQTPWSRLKLLTSMAAALGAAFLLLVMFVLPAEYGIDPTGVGRALGLDRMGAHHAHDEPQAASYFADRPADTDEMQIALAPDEQVEFKAKLNQGAAMLYSWHTNRGSVYADFHSESAQAAMQHRKREAAADGLGSLAAPFSGQHGWYWVNRNDFPVTITVQITGFQDGVAELARQVRQ